MRVEPEGLTTKIFTLGGVGWERGKDINFGTCLNTHLIL